MAFQPRLSEPRNNIKWWISTSSHSGGVNPVTAVKGNSVMPSPVGYVHGRFDEILNNVSMLSCGSPGQLYISTEDGYQRGTNPQLGAVVCWSGSTDNGHVAIVEKIHADGSIVTSECTLLSGWKLETRKPPTYRLNNETSRIFQGFIYNPAIRGTTDKASEFLAVAKSHIGDTSAWSIKTSKLQSSGWSAMFVVACAVSTNLINKLFYKSASATTLIEMSTSMNMGTWLSSSETPQKCDIVSFRFTPKSTDTSFTSDKLGIVSDVTNDVVECIVGDSSGRVSSLKYNRTNKCIAGYYRPNWIAEGANVLNFSDYRINSTYQIESTSQDCFMKEVGYLNSRYEPSIAASDLRLCCMDYTDLLSKIYEKVDSSFQKMLGSDKKQSCSDMDPVNLTNMLGHASINENGKITGGKLGDQTGKEVCIRSWYAHGWNKVLRHPDASVRSRLVVACQAGCNNEHIGYDQSYRKTLQSRAKEVGWDLSKVTTDCATDCSAFMTVCAICAGLHQLELSWPPTTSNMCGIFSSTAGFQVLTDPKYLNSPDYLYPGDILVHEGKHTAMALGYGAQTEFYKSTYTAVEPDQATRIVVAYGMSKGLNLAASCAIAANIKHESGFRTNAVGDHGTSFGLCQWHLGRGDEMKSYVGADWSTNFTGQLDFLWYELTNKSGYVKNVYNPILAVSDDVNGVSAACFAWVDKFEVPVGHSDYNSATNVKRRQSALEIYAGMKKYYIDLKPGKISNGTLTV